MRIGWGSNFSNDLFQMQHRMNQTIWASGLGKKSSGQSRMMVANGDTSGKKKKNKASKKKDKMEEFLNETRIPQNDGSPDDSWELQAESTEVSVDAKSSNGHDTRKVQEERAAAFQVIQKNSESEKQEIAREGRKVLPDGAYLQEAILWSEILGDPVSVKRRKKRVDQIYGNQGNAYRR